MPRPRKDPIAQNRSAGSHSGSIEVSSDMSGSGGGKAKPGSRLEGLFPSVVRRVEPEIIYEPPDSSDEETPDDMETNQVVEDEALTAHIETANGKFLLKVQSLFPISDQPNSNCRREPALAH